MAYPIIVKLIPNLPQKAYRNGVGAYEGVVAHATATYNDTTEGERTFECSHFENAFVHFFVDEDTIEQVADTKYLAWGAGAVANARYVHVELCQSKDPAKFAAAYSRYVWLLAKLLFDRKLGVSLRKTLWGHDDVTEVLGGTTHTDPYEYLASHGKSKAEFVADVTAAYNKLAAPVAPTHVYHVVVSGDTLWDIANEYKTTVAKIQSLNAAKDLEPLQIGTKLIVK
jgi:N-acetylmuramoyl-L-alanine amidase